MKATLPAKALTKILSVAATALPARTVKGIYDNFLLVTGPEGLRATACDGTNVCSAWSAGAKVEEIGAAVIHAERLLAIARSETGDVTVDADPEAAAIRSPAGHFRLPVVPATSFPNFGSDATFRVATVVASADLRHALDAAARFRAHAVDDQRNRAFTGLTFSIDDTFRLAASDGANLIVFSVAPLHGKHVPADFVIPGESAALLKATASACEQLTLSFSPAHCRASGEQAEAELRLLEARPFPWRSVSAQPEGPASFEVHGEDLAAAARAAAALTDEEARHCTLAVDNDGVFLTVANHLGQAKRSVGAVARAGEGQIKVPARVLANAAGCFDDEAITVTLGGNRAARLKGKNCTVYCSPVTAAPQGDPR